MCRAIPVVAAAAGGPLEILENGSGLLFAPHDPRDLALKMFQLLSQPGLRKSLAKAGRSRWAEKFSVPRMARDMNDVYEEVLGMDAGKVATQE
jgi:glycosyltransferase involved in cell wall biosynthesis